VRARALACVAGGLALAISFPPADVGPLAFVALTPLLWAWRGAGPARAALYGFLFGLGFFVVLLEWSRHFGAVAIVPLVVGEAGFIAGAGAIVAALDRRGLRSPWLTAVVWVVIEGARARVPFGGMPWGELGMSMHDLPIVRSLAGVGGVALISFVLVVANGLLLDAFEASRRRARPSLRAARIGLAALVLVTTLAHVVRYTPEVSGRLRFALLQGIDEDRTLTQEEIENSYLMRRHLRLADQLRGSYDLIVFPESALERDPIRFDDVRENLVAVGAAHDATVLANARTVDEDNEVSNSNMAYTPDGKLQGIYSKQHLVPFGEHVPLRGLLSFIGQLDQVPYDYEPGSDRVLFRAAGHRFATVICFESAFAPLVRDFVNDGAELIVVTTNNRSYHRSGLSSQHLAMSQMRAVETARPVLHAAISGITGVIDAEGDVLQETDLFERRITEGTIATTTGDTLFVRLGDWVLLGCLLALLGISAVVTLRARRASAVDSRP